MSNVITIGQGQLRAPVYAPSELPETQSAYVRSIKDNGRIDYSLTHDMTKIINTSPDDLVFVDPLWLDNERVSDLLLAHFTELHPPPHPDLECVNVYADHGYEVPRSISVTPYFVHAPEDDYDPDTVIALAKEFKEVNLDNRPGDLHDITDWNYDLQKHVPGQYMQLLNAGCVLEHITEGRGYRGWVARYDQKAADASIKKIDEDEKERLRVNEEREKARLAGPKTAWVVIYQFYRLSADLGQRISEHLPGIDYEHTDTCFKTLRKLRYILMVYELVFGKDSYRALPSYIKFMALWRKKGKATIAKYDSKKEGNYYVTLFEFFTKETRRHKHKQPLKEGQKHKSLLSKRMRDLVKIRNKD